MDISTQIDISGITKGVKIPISVYSRNLVNLLRDYMDKVIEKNESKGPFAPTKARVVLRHVIFPNDKNFETDYEYIKKNDKIGAKTRQIILNYTKCIMQLLGRVAECLLIDRCMSDFDLNRQLINLALLKEDIDKVYQDIDYDAYIPFSPSFKYVLYKKDGVIIKQPIPMYYNPNDTSTDISWAKRDNVLSQLQKSLLGNNFGEARLQVKVSKNYQNIRLDNKYFLTPIVYFDLCGDVDKLRRKYPDRLIISTRELSGDLHTEIEKYFGILAAYITGITNHIDIDDIDVEDNPRLDYILRQSPKNLFMKDKDKYKAVLRGLIKEAEQATKPIVVST